MFVSTTIMGLEDFEWTDFRSLVFEGIDCGFDCGFDCVFD